MSFNIKTRDGLRRLTDVIVEGTETGTQVPKSINANGTYYASADSADGYSSVTVAVPDPTLVPKTINANGNYTASTDHVDGYNLLTVAVPQPIITTTREAADLTGYEAGDTDLGNGFKFNLTSGTAAVGSETVGGVTYNGLAVTGDTNLVKNTGEIALNGDFQIAEFEFIEKNLTYDSYYGTVRVLSTGGTYFEGSSYFSSDSDYMYFCYHGATKLDPTHQIDVSDGVCYDTTIVKTSIMNTVLNIKYVSDGDYVILYVNNVARLKWSETSFNAILNGYGLKLGAYGVGQNDMLITKAEYRGESLSWDGRTWKPQ